MENFENLRTCFKMSLFLLFLFLHKTHIKKVKNSIKDELTEAAKKPAQYKKSKKVTFLF